MASIRLRDLEQAVHFMTAAEPAGATAWVRLDDGSVLYPEADGGLAAEDSPYGVDDDGLPIDPADSERFVAAPSQRSLGLGKPLALRFARRHLGPDYPAVVELFDARGAFARFARLLEQAGQLAQWQAFEREATRAALREWCGDVGLALDERDA